MKTITGLGKIFLRIAKKERQRVKTLCLGISEKWIKRGGGNRGAGHSAVELRLTKRGHSALPHLVGVEFELDERGVVLAHGFHVVGAHVAGGFEALHQVGSGGFALIVEREGTAAQLFGFG